MNGRRMRVLLATDHYPPFIGGAHRQVQLIARHLAARGHEVTVATVAQPGLPAVETADGFTVHRLRQLRSLFGMRSRRPGQRHQPPFPDPVTVVALRRLMREFRPDLVHAYGWFSYSCAAALAGHPTPLLVSVRDYAYSCPTRTLTRGGRACDGPSALRCLACAGSYYGPLKGAASVAGVFASRPLLARRVAGVHSVSRYVEEVTVRDFLGGRADTPDGRPIERMVVPSFMDGATEPAGEGTGGQLAGLPDAPFILFVGALRRVKGVEVLIEAHSRLVNPPPLVLVGTLERDSPDHFPQGVTLLQNLSHDAVLATWDRALLGVVPSLWPEPLGSVVYEGMSRGRPVIGTVPGGHADMIVDGETGFLVGAGDTDALVHAMSRLIDDEPLRERMGAAARERARLFTAERAIPELEALYGRLLSAVVTGEEQ